MQHGKHVVFADILLMRSQTHQVKLLDEILRSNSDDAHQRVVRLPKFRDSLASKKKNGAFECPALQRISN